MYADGVQETVPYVNEVKLVDSVENFYIRWSTNFL